ncbi:hypothetical protein SAMN05421810_109188 [Amycolatopsis arida]|uniref:Uncharacterized protein n=1 Tax=Amycolatopsis arida TaxID=587909 RepID=A0A1I5ZGQ2_9PSEU|nr:bacteriophage holin [Amycolatopsis arida]TDX89666.1 hypothetical protein CLV69_109187 [Amycolatopsis arida]SFQ55628.1 hypothetical protein SAMN05421810_109188 [Amycolatopsis arida]
MWYVLSIVLVAFGLVVLGAVAARAVRALRRFDAAARLVAERTRDDAGLLRARAAGLRVAMARRPTADRPPAGAG